jgi:hypothetical protein
MFNKILTILCLFLPFFTNVSLASFYDENRPFGHNLSHTDYFPKNSCSVGLQVVACGNSRWAAGTSPFLLGMYNMANIYFLSRLGREINGNKKTLQLAYFKTYNEENRIYPGRPSRRLNSSYQQHSVMAYYIYSQNVRDNYRLHWNVSASYFMDDKHPFSLRRPTYYRRPYQLNLTTLHEVQMTEYMGIQGELGFMHLEDKYPRFHGGASLYFKSKRWLFQFGFTLTSTLDGMFVNPEQPNRFDYQQELRMRTNGYDDPFDKDKIKEDFSLHPEIAIQYHF